MDKLLLKPGEVADALGIGRTKTYELIATGVLPTVVVGGVRRVPAEALKVWLAERAGLDAAAHRDRTGNQS